MTGFEFFYLVALPLGIVAIAYVGLRLHERSAPKDGLRPGE